MAWVYDRYAYAPQGKEKARQCRAFSLATAAAPGQLGRVTNAARRSGVRCRVLDGLHRKTQAHRLEKGRW